MHVFPLDYRVDNDIHSPIDDSELNSFLYSDGDEFEREIYELIKAASDRSLFSHELKQKIWDWRSSCHLSPIRANILRPLEKICHRRILELGSGCGIITRYLGELGGDVTALEASRFRADITRLRTQDLSNVKVVCDRIEDFESQEKFDMVTLIGVLQYARLFSNYAHQAELELLQHAARQLNDSGVLVIAIQNKMGLKYLAGHLEANVGIPYYGIENQYASNTIIRFSQQEIKALLSNIGLPHHTILYPFPDYHMPVSILNMALARDYPSFSADALISASAKRDKIHPDWAIPNFSLEKAWSTVHEAGLTSDLSNAFLIIASKSESAISELNDDVIGKTLAWHYSAGRDKNFTCVKHITVEDNEILVHRAPLQPKIAPNNEPFKHHMESEPYVVGTLWTKHLQEIMNRPGWMTKDLKSWAELWLSAVKKLITPSKNADSWDLNEPLPGICFDYTPLNCIEDENGVLHFIDHEWELNDEISFGYLLFRGLFGSLDSLSSCAPAAAHQSLNIASIIIELSALLGYPLTQDNIRQYNSLESTIQSWVQKKEVSTLLSEIDTYCYLAALTVRPIINKNVEKVHENEKAYLREQLADAHETIHQMILSSSWRITRPLRFMARTIKNKLFKGIKETLF